MTYQRVINILWPSYFVVRAYCICGDAIHISTGDVEHVEGALMDFNIIHQGEGHCPCDAQHCLAARKKRRQ